MCALLLTAACGGEPDAPSRSQDPSSEYDVRADERIAPLLGACPQIGPFTGDTAELLASLPAKLADSEAAVASRVRADLIAAGPSAVPELRRTFQRWFSEPGLAPRLLGLLELAALAGGDEARAMALEALEHPSESVRVAAMRVLAAVGRPEDYDRAAAGVERGGPELAMQSALTLARCDPARVVREYPRWLESERYRRAVDTLAPSIAPIAPKELCDAMLAATSATDTARTWFLARAARLGDAEALARVRAVLAGGASQERQLMVRAAVVCGLEAEIAPLAAADPEPTVRILALEALAAAPDDAAARERLSAALADGDENVRRAALSALCARGDPAAIDVAIELLSGTSDDLALATAVLRAPLARDPALAERVLARLAELLEGGTKSTGRAVERAIGQVPLARAAEILVTRGAAESTPIQDMPAHRWYAVQAGNTGAPGRAWIRARWDVEEDAVRRLDLLSAGAQESTPESFAFLERVAASERASEAERLLACDLLARSSPLARSAPAVQAAARRFTTPEMRRAIACLQWRFYGTPDR